MKTVNPYLAFNGNCGEADTIFNSLSKGGKVTMPLKDTFWGSYFGMFVDKYAFIWMIGNMTLILKTTKIYTYESFKIFYGN